MRGSIEATKYNCLTIGIYIVAFPIYSDLLKIIH